MFEDVAVVHESPREGFKAHENIDDLVCVDSNRVLQTEFIRLESMIDAVIDLVADPHRCNCGGVGDTPVGHLYGGRLPVDDLKGIEVHVDRMRIAG